MKLQYRIIPIAGQRCCLEPIVDSVSLGTQDFPTVAAARRYVEQTFNARGNEQPAWTAVVLDAVETQTIEVIP